MQTLPAAPTITARVPVEDAAAVEAPGVRAIVAALGGLATFGLGASLGAGRISSLLSFAALPLVAIVGAAILTGPGLIAGHLLLDRDAHVDVPIAALGQGLVAGGSVAFGLAPIALFLVTTTGLWAVVLALGFVAIGTAAAAASVRALLGSATIRGGFVAAWLVVAALVSLRLAWTVASTVGGLS